MTSAPTSGYDGAWPAGPTRDQHDGAANESRTWQLIFGQLFELHGGGKLVPGLATAFSSPTAARWSS